MLLNFSRRIWINYFTVYQVFKILTQDLDNTLFIVNSSGCLVISFSAMEEVMRSVRSVCLSVCLVAGLLQKSSTDFVETWSYDWAYQSDELINFWRWSGLGYGFRITFHFSHHCGQVAQLSHHPTLCVVEYFTKSLKVTQGHSKWHPSV